MPSPIAPQTLTMTTDIMALSVHSQQTGAKPEAFQHEVENARLLAIDHVPDQGSGNGRSDGWQENKPSGKSPRRESCG